MREGVVYSVLFLLILGGGAVLILPRVLGGGDRPEPSDPGASESGTVSSDATDVVPAPPEYAADPRGRVDPLFEAAALAYPEDVDVRVTGEGGPLRGPLHPIVGGTVASLGDPEDPAPRLRVTATAPTLWFGAAGHQWAAVAVDDLVSGLEVVLPRAATPIVVRVSEPDGSPAADVPVHVEPIDPSGMPRTDEGGTVVIDHAPAGLVVVSLTTAERAGPRLRLRAGVDREVDVVLEPAWTVEGRVVDGGARPIEDAVIEAFTAHGSLGRAATTGADGSFTWRGRAVSACAFRVRAAGYAERAVEAQPPALAPLHTALGELRMPDAPVTIVCRVDARARNPGAYVEVEPQAAAVVTELFGPGSVLDQPRRRPLPESGEVRFDDLPAGIPLRVAVRGAGVPNDVVVEAEAGATREITLRPEPGHVLAGTLRGAEGSPLVGVRLLVSHGPREGDRALPGDIEIVTGVAGRFQRFGFTGPVAFLRAYVEGHRSLLRRVSLPLDAPLDLELEPALTDAERRIEGIVLSDRGVPLPGVDVRAVGVATTTDADGRFRLDGVESLAPVVRVTYGYRPGPMPAAAPHPGALVASGAVDVTPAAGKPLELVLPGAADVRFRAVDGMDQTPLGFAHVVLRTDLGRIVFDRGVALHDGHFHVRALPVRDDPVRLARRTLADGTVEVVPPMSAATLRLGLLSEARRAEAGIRVDADGLGDAGDIRLPHGMLIRGRVIDAAGRPVAGARVGGFAVGWQSRGTDPVREREAHFRQARSDAEGRFVLEGFDPKRRADLAVWAPGLAPTIASVLLPAFSDQLEAEVEIRLEEGGTLLFVLQDEGSRRPIEGAVMDAEYARDGADYLDLVRAGALGGLVGSTADWRTASDLLLFAGREPGTYAIGPLRKGPYEVWIERIGYEPLRRKVTVFARGENVFDPFAHSTRTVQGDSTRMIFVMRGVR